MTANFRGVYKHGRYRYHLSTTFHSCHTLFVAIELDLKEVQSRNGLLMAVMAELDLDFDAI